MKRTRPFALVHIPERTQDPDPRDIHPLQTRCTSCRLDGNQNLRQKAPHHPAGLIQQPAWLETFGKDPPPSSIREGMVY